MTNLPELPPMAPGHNEPAPDMLADLRDDEPDRAPMPSAAEMAAKREQAVMQQFEWSIWSKHRQCWEKKLLKVTNDRWLWWITMRGHNAPVNLERENFNEDEFAPAAWALLWLCLHEPELILSRVVEPARFWVGVNEWAAVNCPPDQWRAAIEMMVQIRDNISVLLVVPLPTRGSKRLGE